MSWCKPIKSSFLLYGQAKIFWGLHAGKSSHVFENIGRNIRNPVVLQLPAKAVASNKRKYERQKRIFSKADKAVLTLRLPG